MSFMNEMFKEFLVNNLNYINDIGLGVKYYDDGLLEDFDKKKDVPFNFTYNYKDKIYKIDAYIRHNDKDDDDTLKFVYNTKIDDKYHCREFEDLDSIDDINDILEEQIYELIAVNTGDDDE